MKKKRLASKWYLRCVHTPKGCVLLLAALFALVSLKSFHHICNLLSLLDENI